MDWYLYEKQVWEKGFESVCGIDEAGRGPLAGPVFAAAVILPQNCLIDGLNDSKKLSAKKRESLFHQITEAAVSYSIAFATEEEIDRVNILQADFLAMRRAVDGLESPADYALVDGNQNPGLEIPTTLIVKGDSLSANIAAASVLAKVSRDHLMIELDKLYPEYQFAKHKGYGTALHRQLLQLYGPCPVHRKTFLKKILGDAARG